ncbi:ATP-binding protein [Embleya sp. NBC_00896]|uniref:ATP-binding protein n=1 Tax=Embleya sp. NBC_00896 TaxID=2975961 RepID=UPI00386FEA2F|nr:AAA family ATPase [Embleya sp. NBC_00896]
MFIGRTDELARLESAAASAVSQHRLGLALISGDAGAGKSALAEALTRRLADRGWTTAWGRSPEYAGAPAAWPWTEIVAALTAAGHPPDPAFTDLDAARPPAEPAAARFRMHQAFGPYLSTVAAAGPVLLVLDDLHWAGEQTLDLLTALAGRPTAGPVLILGTYRTTEISPALAPALGRWARAEPARVHLEGLPEAQVRELVRATAGRDVDGPTARAIHRRTAGNPFFVRELARLLGTGRGSGSGSATGTGTGSATDTDTEADSALSGIPAGVRDVIRHRLTTLPKPTRDVLHLAAVLGLDVDVDLLVAVTGHEERTLDAVESASRSGFLLDAGPERVRFAHALVRDTLYDDLPRPRRARRHAAVAEALEQLRPDRLDALAHHFLRAESPATAARAVHYAQAAAEQAERRFAPHEAARLWRAAVEAQDHSGAGDARTRLASVMGMVRALAVSGDLASARRYRAQAITAAAELDDQALTAKVIGAFDVPAIWTRNDDEALARQVVEVTERTLAALPRGAAETRARLLGTLAVELRGGAGELGRKSAREATAIARRLDDPALLAFALNGRFLHAFEHAGLARRRAGIGTELLELAERHGLLAFEVLGRLILLQARAALADFDAADEHASAALRLAERYELPLVDVFTDGYAALRLTAADRPEQAETAYRALAARLPGTGMRGLEEGLLPLALLCLRVQDGRPAEPVPGTDFGPYEPWARPLELLAAGRHDEARAAARHIPDAPGDLLHEARTCLAAVAAIAVGDRPLMERAHAALLPAAGELAGAGSGILTLGPVARYLGDLCAALGRPGEARAHHRHALAVARKAHAPHWTAAARAALPGKD